MQIKSVYCHQVWMVGCRHFLHGVISGPPGTRVVTSFFHHERATDAGRNGDWGCWFPSDCTLMPTDRPH